MIAGKLDRRVTIQTYTPTTDAAGGMVEAWTDLATVWCSRLDQIGSEALTAGQINATNPAQFRIRYRPGITPDMRLVCEGVSYDIKSVAEIGRRDGLEIIATARK